MSSNVLSDCLPVPDVGRLTWGKHFRQSMA